MTKWEYHVESLLMENPTLDPEGTVWRETLATVGEDGWEAVAAWPTSSAGQMIYVLFKRPIN
jgi:hypothetical protein